MKLGAVVMSIELIKVFVNVTEYQHVLTITAREMPFYRQNNSSRLISGCS